MTIELKFKTITVISIIVVISGILSLTTAALDYEHADILRWVSALATLILGVSLMYTIYTVNRLEAISESKKHFVEIIPKIIINVLEQSIHNRFPNMPSNEKNDLILDIYEDMHRALKQVEGTTETFPDSDPPKQN